MGRKSPSCVKLKTPKTSTGARRAKLWIAIETGTSALRVQVFKKLSCATHKEMESNDCIIIICPPNVQERVPTLAQMSAGFAQLV